MDKSKILIAKKFILSEKEKEKIRLDNYIMQLIDDITKMEDELKWEKN